MLKRRFGTFRPVYRHQEMRLYVPTTYLPIVLGCALLTPIPIEPTSCGHDSFSLNGIETVVPYNAIWMASFYDRFRAKTVLIDSNESPYLLVGVVRCQMPKDTRREDMMTVISPLSVDHSMI